MDYYGKYIKYKKKYLELSNNKMHSSLNELKSNDTIELINNQMYGGSNKIKSNDTLKLIPKKSVSKNYIKLEFPNINVSQCEYSEGPVGLTFIKFNKGAKVHMEIRGGWPGYINCLSTNEKQIINGINIAGGSLLGLESTTGLTIESLKNNNYTNFEGYNGAIIYSNNLNNNKIYPDKDLGRFACNQNDDKLFNGQVGAGLSASHGQGWSYKKIGKIKILALCVNNALGAVYKNDKPIHYPHNAKKNFMDKIELNKNTTIIILITNLDLDNDELKQMNQQINVSVGESIRPFNTLTDGDILYTCSTGELKNKFDMIKNIKFFDICSQVLKKAILQSVD
jgi:L-aminopeptidase/D-esterase-like protein